MAVEGDYFSGGWRMVLDRSGCPPSFPEEDEKGRVHCASGIGYRGIDHESGTEKSCGKSKAL